MKRLIFVLMVIIGSRSASAYVSGIAIQTEKNSSMQVYVNGKLRTAEAASFFRVTGNPGLYHIMVKVFNPHDKVWYVLRKDIRMNKGYEFYYKINFPKGKRPVLEFTKRYPVYSKYFLHPSLYNKHPVT